MSHISGNTMVGKYYITFAIRYLLISIVLSENKEDEFNYPSIESVREMIGDDEAANLWIVGTFLAAHKYYGVDLRYQAGTITMDDRVFHKKFPMPVLKTFHTDVEKACEQGPVECVAEVLKTALRSGTLKYLLGEDTRAPYEPFKTNFEMYQYRQTAAYYFCWYTMKRSKVLQYVSRQQTCLSGLGTVDDIPKDTRQVLLQDKTDAFIDPRNNAEYYAPSSGNAKPFVCAELWFCPDPCYGRESHGNYIIDKHAKHPGNPCNELTDDTCEWKDRANQDFNSLIRNKFNVSCNCSSDFPGFEWDSRYELCVDKDECYDGVSACQGNRICKNSVGSYYCTCQRGYEINKGTGKCEKTEALHKRARILEYKPKTEDFEKGDFIDDLMDFVGLSAGHIRKAPFCLISFTICYFAFI